MDLMKVMPISAVAMIVVLVLIFFRQVLGPLSIAIAAITALAVMCLLGWFVIDYSH
jgi:hypothetical protein